MRTTKCCINVSGIVSRNVEKNGTEVEAGVIKECCWHRSRSDEKNVAEMKAGLMKRILWNGSDEKIVAEN